MNDLMTKSFVSYVDLKKAAMKEDLEAGATQDVEMAAAQMDPNLSTLFEEAEKVNEEMSSIRGILIRLQSDCTTCNSEHKPVLLKYARARINKDITSVLKKATKIKAKLDSMDKDNATVRRLSDCNDASPVYRARTSVTDGLRRQLKQLMKEFQLLREKMMADYKEIICRRYFTEKGEEAEDEVVEKMMAKGGGEFLRMSVEKETVAEMEERYSATKEVEKSLMELHQVFLDMALMVDVQGEKMDNIEIHVMSASNYVKGGTKELGMAKAYQRSSRRCLCVGAVLLLVLVLVVVVPIATSFSSS